MTNKEVSKALRLIASLGEIHGENEFKLKSLVNGAFQIDRCGVQLEGLTHDQILEIPGIGKGIAQKVHELLQTGTTAELESYLNQTPPGILELLAVKGIGPKKILSLWKQLGIESPGELLYACNENRLVELKGFGEKTQQQISATLRYNLSSKGKMHYAEALLLAEELQTRLQKLLNNCRIEIAGELRRCLEVCSDIVLLIDADLEAIQQAAGMIPELIPDNQQGFVRVYRFAENYTIQLIACRSSGMAADLFFYTGPESHLAETGFTVGKAYASEAEFYKEKKLPFVLPELRDLPLEKAVEIVPDALADIEDIRGCIHAHTTWSDGSHTIAEMAKACIELGYEYLVVTDHSRSASYARGLTADRVLQQHDEIDLLNQMLAPFRIFKGIESDILHDGSLDYPENILSRFDLIIASVHSVLRMDIKKATSRILAALENPYTTMLGHPSGRLLLSREAYPLDYEAVIDTASRHKVVIELNANRFRMDIDWRHIPACMEKSVMIAVNPDAHQKETINDMHYGMAVARKGGLTKAGLFNGLNLAGIENWLHQRRGG
jgi:DNA polymerase (family 10)